MHYRWLLPYAAVLSILFAPSRSAAEPPRTTSVQDNRQLALDYAHQGLDAYKAGRFEEAYAFFSKAQELFPAPTLLVHMARCQRKLGKLVEAKKHYQEVLNTSLVADAPPPFVEAHQDAERELAEVEAEIAAKKESVKVPTPTRKQGSIVPGAVTLGFGVVGLGVGALTGALSQAKVNDIRTRCEETNCLSADRPQADEARMLGNISTAAFVVGGVAVATGAVLLVLRPGNKASVAPTAMKDLRIQVGLGRIDLQFHY